MKELQKIKMSDELLHEITLIDEALNNQIQQFVQQIQAQRTTAVSSLIKGYLIDKEYPKDTNIKVEDEHIIFLDKEESDSN